MGLIKAGMGALGGTLADQWKEFFYCDSLDKDVLMVKGQKRTSRRSSNNGEDNIITNGSGIAVADGQCIDLPILMKSDMFTAWSMGSKDSWLVVCLILRKLFRARSLRILLTRLAHILVPAVTNCRNLSKIRSIRSFSASLKR